MFDSVRWKNISIMLVCLFSFYYAIPTLIPSIETSPIRSYFPKERVNLGLDLKGGASILVEVDFHQYHKDQKQYIGNHILSTLRNNKQSAEIIEVSDGFNIALQGEVTDETISQIKSITRSIGDISVSNNNIYFVFSEEGIKSLKDRLMAQTIEIIRRRIDESGTKEIDLQRQGEDYILLQVPGIESPEEIKNLLGKTAKLTFSLVDHKATDAWRKNREFTNGTKILESDIGHVAVKNKVELTGEMLETAQATVQKNTPGVTINFSSIGSKLFANLTKNHTKEQLAIILDNKVLSAPVINEPILGGSSFISGSFTIKTANELALLLRAGALPAPLKIVEERSVGPSLGSDSINSGKIAVLFGTAFVIMTMLLFYGLFGMIANFAMLINLFMLVAALSLFGATLTLPGIAGMVLTLGMSVDANVLIFERIKEEVRSGRTPLSAIESGYNMAFLTILDSNITTMLAALIMYIMGTGAIKGFAVTLSIGIACSMFTAITVSRAIIDSWYRKYRPKTIPL